MEENKADCPSESNNVIDFVAWKNKKLNRDKNQKICDYFKILSFNELLNESDIAACELASRKPSFELVLKVNILLKEFQKRLQKNQLKEKVNTPPLEGIIFVLEEEPFKE